MHVSTSLIYIIGMYTVLTWAFCTSVDREYIAVRGGPAELLSALSVSWFHWTGIGQQHNGIYEEGGAAIMHLW